MNLETLAFTIDPGLKRLWEPEPEDWIYETNDQLKMTFSDYFLFAPPVDELAEQLGFQLESRSLKLATASIAGDFQKRIDYVREKLAETREFMRFDSGSSRREFLIAPVIHEVSVLSKSWLYSEFPVDAGKNLNGKLDFFLRGKNHSVVVIEAKLADLTKGAKQLVAELVAVSQTEDAKEPFLGAVTIGDDWQFARIDPVAKSVVMDTRLYRSPEQVEEIVRILVAALT